ncbi:MAG: glycosyltransferase [Nitrososphaeria archaeon]
MYLYTERLCEELSKNNDVVIITNKDIENFRESTPIKSKIVKLWRRNSMFAPLIIALNARKLSCNVLVIQYGYSIFGSPMFSQLSTLILLIISKFLGHRTIITLHGVLIPANIIQKRHNIWKFVRNFFGLILLLFYKLISIFSDIIVVLNPLQRRLLENYGVSRSKIVTIPHGAEMCKANEGGGNKPKENRNVFFHGFVRPSKGLLELIEAIKLLSNEGIDVRLTIVGSIAYHQLERLDERRYISNVIQKCRELGDRCVMRLGFHETDELLAIASNSYIIVLPYKDNFVESSGVLHMFMDCGKAVVVSRIPRFLADVSPKEALFVDVTKEDLYKNIKVILQNEELYGILSENLKKKARTRYWHIVAHEWFEALLGLFEG